jgi:hypothetical protein
MVKPIIVEAKIPGNEVERIISQLIFPAVENEERSSVIISLLTLALTLMKPDITAEEIQEGVKGTSEWMVLFLSGSYEDDDLDEGEKRLVN